MEVIHPIENRDAALKYLFGRINYERKPAARHGLRHFHLETMRELMDRLENPHRRLKIVHVAGTKGKGSTSAMLASVLTAAGYRTGLYTSPHLHRIEERFVIDGAPCSEEQLVRLTATVANAASAQERFAAIGQPASPTYFDITTAMALLHFAQQQTDWVVLEVGLGGRLDSTNIVDPQVAIVTTISLDHVRQLGGTLTSIAAEKAGIIKPKTPVITGVTQKEPLEVIRARAEECQSPLLALGQDFGYEYRFSSQAPHIAKCSFWLNYWQNTQGQSKTLEDVPLALRGRHQAANAAVALAAVSQLGQLAKNPAVIPPSAIRSGLERTQCPGRVELVSEHPAVVIDVSHNLASIEALGAVLDEQFCGRPKRLIFAVSREKDARAMLRPLLRRFDHLIMTRFLKNPRAASPGRLLELAREGLQELSPGEKSRIQLSVCEDPQSAWTLALSHATPQTVICVAGSFFLAAEIRELAPQN